MPRSDSTAPPTGRASGRPRAARRTLLVSLCCGLAACASIESSPGATRAPEWRIQLMTNESVIGRWSVTSIDSTGSFARMFRDRGLAHAFCGRLSPTGTSQIGELLTRYRNQFGSEDTSARGSCDDGALTLAYLDWVDETGLSRQATVTVMECLPEDAPEILGKLLDLQLALGRVPAGPCKPGVRSAT